ncbi:hypothetical protein FNF27_04636 [Cafeteria roenbergensis]|uniref:Uncharacterized protein n=1 Tax=Cafeteria roenbergensis TaxID=33653 RepID=A0A5A8CL54_CAFRO|nr:hypothetical protein FNF29_02831 [Cafeteria roenbergensis]KAA0163117.1 hypothetical protein FNF31_02940 [Cafeteria roenbergensis]KAA0164499.1 hypothetical protein FNF28_03840 [Cafeteria roenbergensis]KAA0173880.1 hypothetical protein FNF27_04636 [Cafeteria roenbergensis]|eukprot:KAA0153842.1 hypothetical protein FNF29_02831 [Cafeteria roenbergensis]
MLEEAAHARFLPSLLGGGKDAAPETEPLPDQSTLRAFVESNNAHEDRSTANTCSVCVSIATKHLAGSEDNGLYCLGSKNMGSQQVCVQALLGIYWWLDSFTYWSTYGCRRIVTDRHTGAKSIEWVKPCPANVMCSWMTLTDPSGKSEKPMCASSDDYLKPI